MSDDQFFKDCLGCGLDWDGTSLSPVVDGDQITVGANGLNADPGLSAAEVGLINGTPGNYGYDPGCNGLKFDCETGALWYPTPPCHIGEDGLGAELALSVEGVAKTNQTAGYTVFEPVPESECYDGMIGLFYGSQDFNSTMDTHDFENTNPRIEGYEITYDLAITNGNATVFECRSTEADDRFSVNMFKTCITHVVPFAGCFDPTKGLEIEHTLKAVANYDGSVASPLMDFEYGFIRSFNAFYVKEC